MIVSVSVVIPTYNRGFLISRAIQSVLNQTFQDFEIIVVDDASEDDTKEVIASFDDPRIVYLRNDTNLKGPASRNRGIQAAKGEYIALLDDDDEWLPEKIEKQVKKFTEVSEKVGLVYSGFHYISSLSGKVFSTILPKQKGNVYLNILKGCILGSPTPLIRKRCFEEAGLFDERLPSCQDWDMWIRIAKFYEFDFVPEVLAKHYVHGEQISTDLEAKITSRTTFLDKYRGELEINPAIYSTHLRKLAILYCLKGEQVRGRKLFFEALKKRPFQVKGYAHALVSFLPVVHKKLLTKLGVINVDDIIFYI